MRGSESRGGGTVLGGGQRNTLRIRQTCDLFLSLLKPAPQNAGGSETKRDGWGGYRSSLSRKFGLYISLDQMNLFVS